MLIIKEVEIKLNSANVKHYENLGYKILKRKDNRGNLRYVLGDILLVKVEDLQNSSNINVEVKCDCKECTTPILKPIKWNNYLKSVHEDGKYYCHKCANNLYGIKKSKITKLNNGENSFYSWCYNNLSKEKADKLLDRWDYKKNDLNPKEVGYGSSKQKYWFKCPRNLHKSKLKNISNFTTNKTNLDCRNCNSFEQWCLDNLSKEGAIDILGRWDYKLNNKAPSDVSYGSGVKYYFKCPKGIHKSELKGICIFTSRNNESMKCNMCNSLGYLFPQVLDIWSDKNNKSPFEYFKKAQKKVYWKCPDGKHKDYLRSISNAHTSNFKCPECENNKGELKISEYLIIHNISYIPQKTFDGLFGLGNGLLSYDFYLSDYNLLIEYQGIQHEKPIDFDGKGIKYAEVQFKKQIEHDRRKKEYALSNRYNLLEIWYYDFDNIEDILSKELDMLIERSS